MRRGLPVVPPIRRVGDVLTVREVAALLKVSTAMVYAMVGRGELAHFRVGNAIRVHREAPERLMTTRSEAFLRGRGRTAILIQSYAQEESGNNHS
jgi:excisionase family DNA binding protein